LLVILWGDIFRISGGTKKKHLFCSDMYETKQRKITSLVSFPTSIISILPMRKIWKKNFKFFLSLKPFIYTRKSCQKKIKNIFQTFTYGQNWNFPRENRWVGGGKRNLPKQFNPNSNWVKHHWDMEPNLNSLYDKLLLLMYFNFLKYIFKRH
jgi:hypothetical protein